MVVVTYDRMWLTNTVTLEHLGARTDRAREWTSSVQGEIRTYAAGRQRAIGSIGASAQWGFTLMQLLLPQVETLETWMEAGVTVFARDNRGQHMYGTFFTVTRTELTYTTYGAAIVVQHVDVEEGV